MNLKKYIIIIILTVFLFSIAGVSASDTNETLMTSIDDSPVELSKNNGDVINKKSINGETEDELLGADEDTFQDLQNEIDSAGQELKLNRNYTYNDNGNFKDGIIITKDNFVLDGCGYTIDAQKQARIFYNNGTNVKIKNLKIINGKFNMLAGAFFSTKAATLENCIFTNNAGWEGGAVCFNNGAQGTIINCIFTGNTANNWGGAIYFSGIGAVENCIFTGNKANADGGAIFFYSPNRRSRVLNCNFTDNSASSKGGAVCIYNGDVVNSKFVNNVAGKSGGAIWGSSTSNVVADTCIFKTDSDKAYQVRLLSPTLGVNYSVYKSGDKLTFDLKTNGGISVSNGNILISVFKDNNDWVGNYSCLSGDGWIIDLDEGSYYAIFSTEYHGFTPVNKTLKIIRNIGYYANVVPITTNNLTVNITAKSNFPYDFLQGNMEFILQNTTKISANYTADGTLWAVHRFVNYGDYNVGVYYSELSGLISNDATISVIKVDSTLIVENITLDYGDSINVTVTAGGATGVTAKIGDRDLVVNEYTIFIPFLDAGSYTLTVTTTVDFHHLPVTKNATIIVNKVNSSLTVENITLDYGDSINATVTAYGITSITAKIGDMDLVVDGYDIAIPFLDAGAYTLTVTTIPDGNHLPVTKNATIIINKVNSTLIVGNVAFDYGESINVTVTAGGASGVAAKIGDMDLVVNEYTIFIPFLDAGTYTLTVTTIPDGNHLSVTKNATITVNKLDSMLFVENVDMYYGEPVNVVVIAYGTTGITARIYDVDLVVNGYTILIPNLDVGSYILTVTTIPDANHLSVTRNVTIMVIKKVKTQLSADSVNATYNSGENLVITLKDSKGDGLSDKLLFVDLNGVKIFMTDSKGQINVSTDGLAPGSYIVRVLYTGNDHYEESIVTVTLTVNRDSTSLSVDSITTVYNVGNNLVITLKDSRGNPVGGALISVDLGGVKTFTTDFKGQVRISAGRLAPKTYTVKVTFDGNANYGGSSKSITIMVKKATPKLTAKAKTFKKSVKIKKYSVTLKDNQNKVMKNTKVSIKVNKKVYTAKTNAKGQATFKITKLTKNGKYGAVVTYKGNKYYDKVVMKTKIIVK